MLLQKLSIDIILLSVTMNFDYSKAYVIGWKVIYSVLFIDKGVAISCNRAV